jgi:hypothetical protein
MSAQAEVMVMNMISQGQIAANQRKLFEGFLVGIAVAAVAIALAWGAFAVANTPKSVAPSATTIQTMQEPGLLNQRAGERAGTVAAPATKSVVTDSLVEQRRGERGGSVATPSRRSDHLRRGASLEVPKVEIPGTNGYVNTGDAKATPAGGQNTTGITWFKEHGNGQHGALR